MKMRSNVNKKALTGVVGVVLALFLSIIVVAPFVLAEDNVLPYLRGERLTEFDADLPGDGRLITFYNNHKHTIDFFVMFGLFVAVAMIGLNKVGAEGNAAKGLAVAVGAALALAAIKAGFSPSFFVPFVKNFLFLIIFFMIFMVIKAVMGDNVVAAFILALAITWVSFNVFNVVLNNEDKLDFADIFGLIPTESENERVQLRQWQETLDQYNEVASERKKLNKEYARDNKINEDPSNPGSYLGFASLIQLQTHLSTLDPEKDKSRIRLLERMEDLWEKEKKLEKQASDKGKDTKPKAMTLSFKREGNDLVCKVTSGGTVGRDIDENSVKYLFELYLDNEKTPLMISDEVNYDKRGTSHTFKGDANVGGVVIDGNRIREHKWKCKAYAYLGFKSKEEGITKSATYEGKSVRLSHVGTNVEYDGKGASGKVYRPDGKDIDVEFIVDTNARDLDVKYGFELKGPVTKTDTGSSKSDGSRKVRLKFSKSSLSTGKYELLLRVEADGLKDEFEHSFEVTNAAATPSPSPSVSASASPSASVSPSPSASASASATASASTSASASPVANPGGWVEFTFGSNTVFVEQPVEVIARATSASPHTIPVTDLLSSRATGGLARVELANNDRMDFRTALQFSQARVQPVKYAWQLKEQKTRADRTPDAPGSGGTAPAWKTVNTDASGRLPLSFNQRFGAPSVPIPGEYKLFLTIEDPLNPGSTRHVKWSFKVFPVGAAPSPSPTGTPATISLPAGWHDMNFLTGSHVYLEKPSEMVVQRASGAITLIENNLLRPSPHSLKDIPITPGERVDITTTLQLPVTGSQRVRYAWQLKEQKTRADRTPDVPGSGGSAPRWSSRVTAADGSMPLAFNQRFGGRLPVPGTYRLFLTIEDPSNPGTTQYVRWVFNFIPAGAGPSPSASASASAAAAASASAVASASAAASSSPGTVAKPAGWGEMTFGAHKVYVEQPVDIIARQGTIHENTISVTDLFATRALGPLGSIALGPGERMDFAATLQLSTSGVQRMQYAWQLKRQTGRADRTPDAPGSGGTAPAWRTANTDASGRLPLTFNQRFGAAPFVIPGEYRLFLIVQDPAGSSHQHARWVFKVNAPGAPSPSPSASASASATASASPSPSASPSASATASASPSPSASPSASPVTLPAGAEKLPGVGSAEYYVYKETDVVTPIGGAVRGSFGSRVTDPDLTGVLYPTGSTIEFKPKVQMPVSGVQDVKYAFELKEQTGARADRVPSGATGTTWNNMRSNAGGEVVIPHSATLPTVPAEYKLFFKLLDKDDPRAQHYRVWSFSVVPAVAPTPPPPGGGDPLKDLKDLLSRLRGSP